MKRNLVRAAAVGGVAALAMTSAAPGYAATVVAQSSAAALEISIAGQSNDSGRVVATASDDGTQNKEGQVNPPIQVLTPQNLLNIGVLAQDAIADVVNGNGLSAACAGVAGEGGAVAQVGDSNCLTPGQPIDFSFANLDLTGTQLADEDSALAPLNQLGNPLFEQVIGPVTNAISEGLQGLGTVELGGTIGAIQARCNAQPGTAQGDATLLNSQIAANLDGTEVVLLDFPANPEPNTEVVTDLDEVVNLLLDALRTDLNNSLEGALAPLGDEVIAPIQEQIVTNVIGQISNQLAPLEENVIRATLNKQTRTSDSIDVTALDLDVLPAAADSPLAAPLVEAIIANVTCGPNARVGAPEAPETPDAPDNPGTPQDLPEVPTAVDSGAAGEQNGADAALLAGALLALGGALGATGYRRVRS